jgi:outer membrane protein assembly factor BamB
MPRGVVAMASFVILLGAVVAADQWQQFRGPQAGVAPDHPDLPDTWSRTENVRWAREIAGTGWSSPIVWDDHVFVTSVVSTGIPETPKTGVYLGDWPASTAEHRWMVYALDRASGAIRWTREVKRSAPPVAKHLKNSYASETPVTDGQRVYAYFGQVGLFAFDFDGRPVWSKPLGPFKTRNNWGTGASPVLHRDRIYVVSDTDEGSFVAAFDTRTGDEVWRVPRDEGTNWSTPFIWQHASRTELVTNGSDRVRSYDLSGRLLWHLRGMSSITIPTPFASHGLLFLNSGYVADPNRPTMAVRPGASGDISLAPGETSNRSIAWSLPTGAPYNPTPLVYRDAYYTLFDRGFLTSHDPASGREIYGRQRITAGASGFTASPWAYHDRIFAMSEDGDTFVIKAGAEFAVIGTNSLGEMALATPAVADGDLLIRTASRLYCLSRAARQP